MGGIQWGIAGRHSTWTGRDTQHRDSDRAQGQGTWTGRDTQQGDTAQGQGAGHNVRVLLIGS